MRDFADVSRIILRVAAIIIADTLFHSEFVMTSFSSGSHYGSGTRTSSKQRSASEL